MGQDHLLRSPDEGLMQEREREREREKCDRKRETSTEVPAKILEGKSRMALN